MGIFVVSKMQNTEYNANNAQPHPTPCSIPIGGKERKKEKKKKKKKKEKLKKAKES